MTTFRINQNIILKLTDGFFEVEVMDNFELKIETPKNIKDANESTEATIDCPYLEQLLT